MTSAKQAKANQENSQKSTGPKTVEGKTAVSKNALKHGLLSKEALLPWENQFEFEQFSDELMVSLKPENAIEHLIVDKIISVSWRLQRSGRIEAGLIVQNRYSLNFELEREELKTYSVNTKSPLIEKIIQQNAHQAISTIPDNLDLGAIFEKDADTINKLQRYETGLERSFYKALHELQRLQATRKGHHVNLPLAVDVNGDKNEE
ncbi:MAG: hypothetical protein V4654_08850 [Bdellovibrionota bacterium]